MVKEGVNLSAFDSIENARDVESLRQALGYEKINLYGVSYGTLLALHVMREFPEGLRSVIIDSVVPPETNFMIEASTSNNRALEAVFSGCASELACNKAYPNLRQVFYDTVERLNANKVNVQLTDFKNGKDYTALIDGNAFLSAVVQMLYMTDLIPLIPRVIYQARSGDFAFLNRILSLVVFDRTMSIGMYYSVTCSENSDFNSQEVKYSDLPKPLAESEKDNVEQFIETCSFWKVDPLEASVGQPVKSDVPTLVLTGSFDPITPPAYAKQAASTLSSSHLFEFPVGGHGELTSGECQDQIVLQFLDNPARETRWRLCGETEDGFQHPRRPGPFPCGGGPAQFTGRGWRAGGFVRPGVVIPADRPAGISGCLVGAVIPAAFGGSGGAGVISLLGFGAGHRGRRNAGGRCISTSSGRGCPPSAAVPPGTLAGGAGSHFTVGIYRRRLCRGGTDGVEE